MTAQVLELGACQNVGESCKGTSLGSVYYTLILGAFNVAARFKTTGSSHLISFRIERNKAEKQLLKGGALMTLDDVTVDLTPLGFVKQSSTHVSMHRQLDNVWQAVAFLFGVYGVVYVYFAKAHSDQGHVAVPTTTVITDIPAILGIQEWLP